MITLFKYVTNPEYILKDGFIRATQLSALNDPFEATYCEKGLQELASHFDESTVLDGSSGAVSFPKYIESNKDRVGVICFSESKDNLLMWSHYADEHRGVVLAFHDLSFDEGMFENLIKPEISTSWGGYCPFDGVPKHVLYRKQPRYRIDKFDFDYSNISMESGDRVLFEVFLQKSDEWIYEKERRIVLRLEQADKVRVYDIELIKNEHVRNSILNSKVCSHHETEEYHEITLMSMEDDIQRAVFAKSLANLSNNNKNIYLFKLKPNSINSCILGMKSPFTLRDIASKYFTSIGYYDVFKAKQNASNYSIDFTEL